jgi:hypothetical protein
MHRKGPFIYSLIKTLYEMTEGARFLLTTQSKYYLYTHCSDIYILEYNNYIFQCVLYLVHMAILLILKIECPSFLHFFFFFFFFAYQPIYTCIII